MTALLLVGLAALVAGVAGRVLPGARWVLRAPRLGLSAWCAVLVVFVVSLVTAAVSVVVMVVAGLATAWPGARDTVCAWWAWCVRALGGEFGPVARVVGLVAVLAVAVALAVAVGRLTVAGLRSVRRLRAHRRAHLEALNLVGHWHSDLAVRVIDCPRPAAYLVHRQVVVTSGALDTLPPAELAAVVAHERAHAAGRHQLLADAVRLLAAISPGAAVFTCAADQIPRLVEIRADEVAAAQHGRLEVARAIVACAHGAAPAPAAAMAASGGNALERVNRLLTPPARLPAAATGATALGLLVLTVMPALTVVAAWTMPAFLSCSTGVC